MKVRVYATIEIDDHHPQHVLAPIVNLLILHGYKPQLVRLTWGVGNQFVSGKVDTAAWINPEGGHSGKEEGSKGSTTSKDSGTKEA